MKLHQISRIHKNTEGFTLIELMIVVAIIGILAAIAIPQFAQYRIRGFNASAQSDLRNLNTSEAAFYADWQVYGMSAIAAGAGGAAGAILTGPDSAANPCLLTALAAGVGGANQTLTIGLGNLVSLAANTNPVVGAVAANTFFTAGSKHQNGDTIFGVDSVSTSFYRATLAAVPAGTTLTNVVANIPLPLTTGVDPYVGLAGFVAQ